MTSSEKQIEVVELEVQVINQIGKCTLINEDCITAMDKLIAEGIKVDCVLTDPPYEYDNGSGGGEKWLPSKKHQINK